MCFFIEFEPLCQKLWAFLSNFGSFYDATSCHVTQDANFENCLFCPNSTIIIIRKSHKISGGKTLYFRSYQQKTSRGGGGGNTPLSAFRVNIFSSFRVIKV